jgi:hypothetical protein
LGGEIAGEAEGEIKACKQDLACLDFFGAKGVQVSLSRLAVALVDGRVRRALGFEAGDDMAHKGAACEH